MTTSEQQPEYEDIMMIAKIVKNELKLNEHPIYEPVIKEMIKAKSKYDIPMLKWSKSFINYLHPCFYDTNKGCNEIAAEYATMFKKCTTSNYGGNYNCSLQNGAEKVYKGAYVHMQIMKEILKRYIKRNNL